MAKIEVYTTRICPYCTAAKNLLKRKGLTFEEIDVETDDSKRSWLVETTGQRTVPQIFVDGKSLGGFSDIEALDKQGGLDALLGLKLSAT